MIAASLKALLRRRASLIASLFAIVLGTAFVSGSLIVSDQVQRAYESITLGTVADVNVRPDTNGAQSANLTQVLTEKDVERVRELPGVEYAAGTISATDAFVLNQASDVANEFAPGLGMAWHRGNAAEGRPGLTIIEGREPRAAGEVVLDPDSLTNAGTSVGDTVELAIGRAEEPVQQFTVVGTGLFGTQSSAGGATYAFFSTEEAQQLFLGGEDAFHGMWVQTKEGQDPATVAQTVAADLPEGFDALTAPELAKELEGSFRPFLQMVTALLLAVAGVALLIGAFLISNTFSVLVSQRTGELALFRAMGASRGQVVGVTLLQSLLMGLVGSVIGLFAGLGVAQLVGVLLESFGMDFSGTGLSIPPAAIIATLGVGVVVTLLAGLAPALRAGRVEPVAAMRTASGTGEAIPRWQTVLGAILAVGGAGVLVAAALGTRLSNQATVAAGAAALVIGAFLLLPTLAQVPVWLLSLGTERRGLIRHLAAINLHRQPRRLRAAAASLMVGLAALTALGTVVESSRETLENSVSRSIQADYLVQGSTNQSFSPQLAKRLAGVDGVSAVHEMWMIPGRVGEASASIGAITPRDFGEILEQKMLHGSPSELEGNSIILTEELALTLGVAVGDDVTLSLTQSPQTVKVVGIMADGDDANLVTALVPSGLPVAAGLEARDTVLGVDLEEGAATDAVRPRVDAIVEDYPLVSVADAEQYVQIRLAPMQQTFGSIAALLALTWLIATLGVLNTLALSVMERTREIGFLRALGLDRSHVRRIIMVEAVVMSLVGGVAGVVVGLLIGWSIQGASGGSALADLSIPWGPIVIALVSAVVAGLLGGWIPARIAARAPVLSAVAAR